MFWLSGWRKRKEHKKRYKWLIEEFPKLAVAMFESLRDLNHPDTPKERTYERIAQSFGYTIGLSYSESNEAAVDIVQRAKLVNSLNLRTIVILLICETAGLRTQPGVELVMACVYDVIPESY